MLAGSPRFITDRLQRVLNAAARVVTGTRKFDRGLSDLLHSELHWLDIYQRVQYLVDCCMRTSDVSSRQRLRSANRRQLVVPRTTSSQQVRTPIVLHCSSDGLELVSRLPSGPNAKHRQLQIDIKDSPVRGATGHVAHQRRRVMRSTKSTATTTTTTTTLSLIYNIRP